MQTPRRSEILSLLADLDSEGFETAAKAVFRYQSVHNPLYAKFLKLLHRRPAAVRSLPSIPFLPIRFFKSHDIKTGVWKEQATFRSSGTTEQTPSRHFVRDPDFYLNNARRGFSRYYGDPSEWRILALLPSYVEREGSSLVAMAAHFIKISGFPESGFFLNEPERLCDTLLLCQSEKYKTLLLGVSFALLDFAERFPVDLSGVIVMETGGMKGRRRELTRNELHRALREAFNLDKIHSEYGMTELFSQAYAPGGDGLFSPAPTLRALATEINDPFCPVAPGRTGVLNFIDLANFDTCSFIQTDDVGRVYADGRFEVLGRLDAAELRGCNLMVEL